MDELGGLAKPAVASAKLAAAARTSTRPAKAVQPLATVRSLRARIFLTLEDPTSSVTAKVISGFILSVIILSICTYCAGTMLVYAGPDGRPGTCPEPSLGGYLVEGDRVVACDPFALDGNATASAGCTPCSFPDAAWWARLEMLCAIVFSIEYVSRLLCCPTARLPSWVVEPLNVLDLVSIAPWYLEQFVIEQGTHTQVVRALRLLRIFRAPAGGQVAPWPLPCDSCSPSPPRRPAHPSPPPKGHAFPRATQAWPSRAKSSPSWKSSRARCNSRGHRSA